MNNEGYNMKITNDCKGKSQSFECLIELKNQQGTEFCGYGEDELSSKEDCLEKMKEYSEMLNYSIESLDIDIRMEKSGVKSYLNKVDVLFRDSMDRYEIIKEMLERNGYECFHDFSPMVGPNARFVNNKLSIIFSCINKKGVISIFYSGVLVFFSKEFDFENINMFEGLIKGLFPDLDKTSTGDKEEHNG